MRFRLRTLMKLLVLCTCLVQAARAEETAKVLIALQEIRIDSTAAARMSATFVTMDDDKRQIVIGLSGPDRVTDLNSKNILAIIRLFPAKRYEWILERGGMPKPGGKLIFLVPREKPEEKLSEWELSGQSKFSQLDATEN